MARAMALDLRECVNQVCPWTGRPVSTEGLMRYRGRVIGFCSQGERDRFARAVAMFDAAIAGKPGSED